MKCERCDNVAVEHVAVREGGKTRELHLCECCAVAESEIAEPRQQARLSVPKLRLTNMHDFIRQWQARRTSLGRELSKEELIELLDRLYD
jgi:protein-arginine kinase activator protein McsA